MVPARSTSTAPVQIDKSTAATDTIDYVATWLVPNLQTWQFIPVCEATFARINATETMLHFVQY
jgi:hypothetical protein